MDSCYYIQNRSLLSCISIKEIEKPMLPWILGPQWLSGINLLLVLLGGGMSAFVSLFILLLWVPSYNEMPSSAKKHIEEAYVYFIISALFLLFGVYFGVIVGVAVVLYIIHVLVNSIRIMFGKE